MGAAMWEYAAYYRVSADRQGASELGLDAQRDSVNCHIGAAGKMIAEDAVSLLNTGQFAANSLGDPDPWERDTLLARSDLAK